MPAPRSTTRSSTTSRNALAASRTRSPGGLWRTAFARRFTTTRCSSTASASTGGRSSARSSSTSRRTDAELVERREHDVGEVGRRELHGERAGLQPAHVEEVRDELGERVEALGGGVEQLLALLGGEVEVGRAQRADRRRRRRERAPEVVAHRGEECRAHPVGLGERPRGLRGLGEGAVLDGLVDLGRDDLRAGGARMPRGPGRAARARACSPIGTFVTRSSRVGSPSATRGSPSTSRRTPVRPNASRVRVTIACSASSPRSTLPASVASSCDSAAARWADARAPGGLVDDVAHEQRVRDVEHEREELPRVADGERVQRLDEEEVQRESRQHRREQRGPDAADERDDDDEQLVGEHVARDRRLGAERHEQPAEQRPGDRARRRSPR